MGPGGVEDKPKTENVDFPLVLKHFQLRENGETTQIQRRNNGGTTEKQPRNHRAAASCRGFSIGFSTIFSILIFEPLLEPLQYTTVREKVKNPGSWRFRASLAPFWRKSTKR